MGRVVYTQLWSIAAIRVSLILIFLLNISTEAYAVIPTIAVETGNVMPKSKLTFGAGADTDEPVLLEADSVEYDQENAVVIASGKVAVSQGDTVLLADTLIYDRNDNRMLARGNVSMLEPSGHVYFAEALELKNQMKAGVIENFKARLADNSLFVAAHATKVDENVIELDKAVYSPCKVCESNDPLWQLKASHIKVDQEEQKVMYDDAYFEVHGLPIFYTPYFSHPTPDADNQSGLLMPEYIHTENLGSVYKIPLYYAIAPDKDVTVIPIYTSLEGLVMAGEYRQKFDSGAFIMDGSITRPQDRDPGGSPTSGNQIRGHFNANGNFIIDEHHDWGLDIHRTTDDTYLRRYNFSGDPLLTSKIYAQGYNFDGTNDRSYAIVQGLAFQGLNAQDNSATIPMVMPLADITLESDPGIYNSRFTFTGNAMMLTRDLGTESRRLSATTGWKLPYITDDGQSIEFATELRGDVYSVENVALSDGTQFDGTTGRLVPQASLTWRYPFINRFETSSLLLEPIVSFAVSPNGGNQEEIPNEDSLVPEFTDTNLFSANRFAGYDRVESGPRVSYGLRGQAQVLSDKYIDWMFGQHYRINNDRNFPFSNDLTNHFSDYVGKLGFDIEPVYLAYRFRLDKDGLAAKRNEVDATFNFYPLYLTGSYLSLKNDPVLATKEQAQGVAGLNLTREWSVNVGANRDLLLNQWVSTSMGLTYQDECTYVTGIIGREFTRDRDLEPSTSFLFRVSLKNLN